MSDESIQSDNGEEDFQALLDAQDQIIRNEVFVGEKIRSKVIAITSDTLFLDLGAKIDGIAVREEFLDDQGQLACKVGDELELFVTAVSETEIILSRSASGRGSQIELNNAFQNQVPVQGKVKDVCKGGFIIEMMSQRAFCPISQIDVAYVETPEDYLGQAFDFRILRLEEKGRNIIVSRRALLEEAREAEKKRFLQELQSGAMLEGTVTRLMPYGAFVELCPGLEGMVHISELSWSRIEKPDNVVQTGDRIPVKVIEIKAQSNSETPKIALSAKQVAPDPWERWPRALQPGAKVTGTVTRCTPFGAFVEVAPGIEGLVHISEMSYTQRVLQPEDIVTPQELVSVMIKSIDVPNRKLSLSLRDAVGDPWLEVADRYRSGQKVSGIIEKKETFGYLVALEPGIVGLLPASQIHKAAEPARLEKLKPGDAIPILIQNVDALNRRISLLPADTADSENWQAYTPDSKARMGSLAEKLQAALAAKKPKP